MSNPHRQPEPAPQAIDEAPPRTLATDRLHNGLSQYRSRHAPGHETALREITAAVDDLVDEMRLAGRDPSAVIVTLKALLAEYPATALIHANAVRRCIERYYATENPAAPRPR